MGNKDMSDLFLELVQVAIGNRSRLSQVPTGKLWERLYAMSRTHGLVGICFPGILKLGAEAVATRTKLTGESVKPFEALGMSRQQYFQWMGVAAEIQQHYERYESCIAKLAASYAKERIGMMLLKGYGLSRHYPVPQMRAPGDADIFLFDMDENHPATPVWKRGDEAVSRSLNVTVRCNSEHHTSFDIGDVHVENHYDFINTRIRRSSQKLDKELKALARDRSRFLEIDNQKVFLPSDHLNALFLLRHTAGHFASEGIMLRHVLDWGFFVCSVQSLDWNWLWARAKEYNMHRFLACLNAICTDNLSMDSAKFVQQHATDTELKERVLHEILKGLDKVEDASAMLRTVRWWQHRWKHRICYSDSLLSSFIYSIRANIGGTSVE